jgi:hypothetical protein
VIFLKEKGVEWILVVNFALGFFNSQNFNFLYTKIFSYAQKNIHISPILHQIQNFKKNS